MSNDHKKGEFKIPEFTLSDVTFLLGVGIGLFAAYTYCSLTYQMDHGMIDSKIVSTLVKLTSVDKVIPQGFKDTFSWFRSIPASLFIVMVCGIIGRLAIGEPKKDSRLVENSQFAVQRNGVDTPELDHLTPLLNCTPGDHSKLWEMVLAHNIPITCPSVRLVPLNITPSSDQVSEAQSWKQNNFTG